MEIERLAEGAACGTTGNSSVPAPSSGQWASKYREKGQMKQSFYDIQFTPEGNVTGSGNDDDGPFNIVHGVYNVNNRKAMWREQGTDWYAEISVEWQPDNANAFSGKYMANTGVGGDLTINLQSSRSSQQPAVAQSSRSSQQPAVIGQVAPVGGKKPEQAPGMEAWTYPSHDSSMVEVEVPKGAKAGTTLQIQTANGPKNVVVPKGVQEGQTFQVKA